MFDWFFNALTNFQQSIIYEVVLEQAKWVDWFALLFIVLGIIYGIENGFLSEVVEVIQILAVIFVVFEFYPGLQHLIAKYASFVPLESRNAVAYLMTAFGVWVAAGLLLRFFRRFYHTQMSSPLHYGGGALLGALHLFIIYSFIAQTLLLLPVKQPKRAFEPGASFTGKYVARLAPEIHDMIRHPLSIIGQVETDKK